MKLETLKPNQQKAILCLLECNSVAEAAKQSKISESCLWEWMKDEIFAATLNQQREILFQEAMSHVKASSLRAAETLLELLNSPDERLRRSVANDLLDKAIKFKEIMEFEERIVKLERMVG